MRSNTPWTNTPPTDTGAYWVRGFAHDHPGKAALVEVRADDEAGALRCNLDTVNSDPFNRPLRDWRLVSRMDTALEWRGPLT